MLNPQVGEISGSAGRTEGARELRKSNSPAKTALGIE
jgi:hypothetical protein